MSCEKRPTDGTVYGGKCEASKPLELSFAVNDENPNEYLFEFSKPVVPGMGLT
jgi:hypothetical protein